MRRLREEGYDFGGADVPGLASGDGDELIRALIEAGGHDQDWLTEEQLARNPVRIPAADYRRWYATLPEELRTAVEEHWGRRPAKCSSTAVPTRRATSSSRPSASATC